MMSKKYSKLHISVAVHDITDIRVFLVNVKTGKHKELQPGVNFDIEYVQPRTERCQACDQTYPISEIVRRGAEQLCLSCDADKYPIRDEDIPF